jgi:hypothetical protein
LVAAASSIASELLRLEGMAVSNAHEAGDQLELEVKLVAAASVCPTYGRGTST